MLDETEEDHYIIENMSHGKQSTSKVCVKQLYNVMAQTSNKNAGK